MIKEGEPAPDFELTAHDGVAFRLSSLRGERVVLYFYPRDDTPGCTTQACGLRDSGEEISARGAVVVGVSPDTTESHVAFRAKHALDFTLLSDPDHEVAEQYDVWREKSMYGRKFMGIHRSTFVIDRDGTVARAMYGVRPKQHVDKVLAALDAADAEGG